MPPWILRVVPSGDPGGIRGGADAPIRKKAARYRKARLLCHHVLMPKIPQAPDEPPPFLGTWRRVYAAILIYLGLIIAGAYLFTRAYR